jgi:multidrug resistance efflux pump
VESARAAVSYLRIISPIDGIVTGTEPGMHVTPGMPLLSVEDDQTNWMRPWRNRGEAT